MEHGLVLLGRKPPLLMEAVPLVRRIVRITWKDGASEIKDVMPLLANRRSLVRLRSDDALFASLAISEDLQALEWPDGSRLSALAIAQLPQTSMEAREFRHIMDDLQISVESLSALLGLSRRVIADYRAGKPIPKTVALALRYLLERTQALR